MPKKNIDEDFVWWGQSIKEMLRTYGPCSTTHLQVLTTKATVVFGETRHMQAHRTAVLGWHGAGGSLRIVHSVGIDAKYVRDRRGRSRLMIL